MQRWQQRSLQAVAVIGVVIALIAAFTWVLTVGGGSKNTPGDASALPSESPSATPTSTPSPTVKPSPTTKRARRGQGAIPGWAGNNAQSGLSGTGWSIPTVGHTVLLEVSAPSAQPMAVGWYVPTSRDGVKGSSRFTGSAWSHRATAYGRPDYARLWVFSGPSGVPLTCTIVVDGHVRDRRTTSGPYGKVMCQG